jgi:hypothetical protein
MIGEGRRRIDFRRHGLFAACAENNGGPSRVCREWGIRSADLDLQVRPLYTHHSTLKLPPVLPFIDIDYYEILGAVEGTARRNGKAIPIRGIGKFDHNFNFW